MILVSTSVVIFVGYITLILASHLPHHLGVHCSNSSGCSCAKSFALSKANICEPIFTKGCPAKMSFCLGNSSVCRCNKKIPYLKDEECNRECRINCPGRNCIVCKQTECLCPSGYTMSNGQCQPICKDGCPNGYCFRPEICLCNNGYARSINGTCSSICTGDGNGIQSRCLGLTKNNNNSKARSSSNHHHEDSGVLYYWRKIIRHDAKLIMLILCSILLSIVLLSSVFGLLRKGTYNNLASEEFKPREPFYVYY